MFEVSDSNIIELIWSTSTNHSGLSRTGFGLWAGLGPGLTGHRFRV